MIDVRVQEADGLWDLTLITDKGEEVTISTVVERSFAETLRAHFVDQFLSNNRQRAEAEREYTHAAERLRTLGSH